VGDPLLKKGQEGQWTCGPEEGKEQELYRCVVEEENTILCKRGKTTLGTGIKNKNQYSIKERRMKGGNRIDVGW